MIDRNLHNPFDVRSVLEYSNKYLQNQFKAIEMRKEKKHLPYTKQNKCELD